MKRTWLLWLLLASLPLVVGLGLMLGAAGPGWPDLSTAAGEALLGLRLHRVLAGFFVGAGLACAGAIMQALLRNPLADPYLLGVSSGGALGAALVIVGGLAARMEAALPIGAFLGGLGALALVYALACQGGAPSTYGLILSGVIVNAVAASVLMTLISLASIEGLHTITWWMLGNLQIGSSALLAICAGLITVGLGASRLLARDLNALTLGREAAHHLGVRTALTVGLGLALATLMASAAVAMAGLIGFVGLVVPHVVRGLIGPNHRWLLPASALAGGLFLVLCDALARSVLAPMEIPAGVVTAVVGGPFFLALLRRHRRRGWVE